MAFSKSLPLSDFSLEGSLVDGIFSNTMRTNVVKTTDGLCITSNLTGIDLFTSSSKIEGTLAFSDATQLISPHPKMMFDSRSGLYVYVLNVQKIPNSIDETEGILSDLALKLEEERIDTTTLIKRAWKTSE